MFFCCVYLLCILQIVNCSPDVQLYPKDPMAALSSWVNFTCSGSGSIISWRVNNELIVGSELKSRNVTVYHHSAPAGNVSSTLVILASHNNDAISIACVAKDEYGFIDFEITILRVEGITPVRNLTVKDSDDAMLITWDEPVFQSAGINAVTVYYNVIVTESDSLIFSVKDIVDRQYSVSLNLFSLCSVYSIGVVAYDGLFASDANSVLQQDGGDVNISVVDHLVTYERGMFSIKYFVSVNGSCNCSVSGITKVHNGVKDMKILQMDSNSEMYTYTATNLTHGLNGNVLYLVNDLLHSVKAAVNISFTTTHVTGVYAFIGNDGSICVECSFIHGSDADGCEIELRDRVTDDCVSCRYTISKVYSSSVSSKCFSHPFEGNFSVYAYDIVGGKKSPFRAAVYTELPEYLLVPVEHILLSTVSLVLCTNSTSAIETRVISINNEFRTSSFLTEIPVPSDVNLLTLIPAFVSSVVVCVFLVTIVVVSVYYKSVANRSKERKEVFEQTSPIAEQNLYEQNQNVQLYEYAPRRSRSVESDLQFVSEFVPDRFTPVQAQHNSANLQSNSSTVEDVSTSDSDMVDHPVQHLQLPKKHAFVLNQTVSCAQYSSQTERTSLDISGIRHHFPEEFCSNPSFPDYYNTEMSGLKHELASSVPQCSFNSIQVDHHDVRSQYANLDFKMHRARAPPAQQPTQYASIKTEDQERSCDEEPPEIPKTYKDNHSNSVEVVTQHEGQADQTDNEYQQSILPKACSEQGLLLTDSRDKNEGTALDLLKKNSYNDDVQKRKEQCLEESKGSMAKMYQQVEEVN